MTVITNKSVSMSRRADYNSERVYIYALIRRLLPHQPLTGKGITLAYLKSQLELIGWDEITGEIQSSSKQPIFPTIYMISILTIYCT